MEVASTMLGLAGAYTSKRADDANQLVERMTSVMQHRGDTRTIDVSFNGNQRVLVAYHAFYHDNYMISSEADGVFIVDGIQPQAKCVDRLLKLMDSGKLFSPDLVREISQTQSFSECLALSVGETGLQAVRFPFSLKPFYLHWDNGLLLFASEKKCMWTLGVDEILALQPGEMCTASREGGFQQINAVERTPPRVNRSVSRKSLINRLGLLLRSSLERIRSRNAAVLFSGGVDSSLIAKLANELCDTVVLYTTRTEDSHDKTIAGRSAQALGLELVEVEMQADAVWEALPSLLWATETSCLMDIEIALPFFLAARKASQDGLTLMVSGQGPDELFAGYARHLRLFDEGGTNALEEQLWKEVSMTHELNIERDERAIAFHSLEAIFPYLETSFVNLSMTTPGEWKVDPDSSPSQKILFRELARALGLPEEIAMIPKRATQYSSGSGRVIQEAVSKHVRDASSLGRKKLRALTQAVLDRLSHEMGMPVALPTERIDFKTPPTLPSPQR